MKIVLASLCKMVFSPHMSQNHRIYKNENGQFEAWYHGTLLDIFATEEEAKTALDEEEKEDQEFCDENGI